MTKEKGVRIVHIKNDFPNEFSGSVYTEKLKGGLAKVKANLSQGVIQVYKLLKKAKVLIIKRGDMREMRATDGITIKHVLQFLFLLRKPRS